MRVCGRAWVWFSVTTTHNTNRCTHTATNNRIQQLGAEIGRGGFGAVYQALNIHTGDMVAVKRLELAPADDANDAASCASLLSLSVYVWCVLLVLGVVVEALWFGWTCMHASIN